MGTPATISQVGTMWTANNNSGFCTSITLNPVNVGDLFVLVIELKYSNGSNRSVTGISGTGLTWQGTATFQRFMADGVHAAEIWYGTVTATGSHTHTVSYSSTTGQSAGSINGHQLTSTAGSTTVWSVDGAAGTNYNDPNVNGTTFTYPTLTSALDKECYIGYLAIAGSASAGSGAGWVYTQDLRGNWDAVNVNIGNAGPAASPTQPSGTSQGWFTIGVLFQAATSTTTHVLAATGLASTSGSLALPLVEPLGSSGLASSSGAAALNIIRTLSATGLAATTGSMTCSLPLAAAGLASTSGAAALVVIITLSATGLVSTSGSLTLPVIKPLSATGVASSSGAFGLAGPNVLSAVGLISTSGTASLLVKRPLAAPGLISTSGSMNLGVRTKLASVGRASTFGSFGMLVGKLQNPFATPVFSAVAPVLDCGVWRVFIATRGGGTLLAEWEYESLSVGRKLNDVSACSVTVMAAKNA